MWFKSQRYNNAALQKSLIWFVCACYNTKRNFQMLLLNSSITNCKIIPIHAMLFMNISHGMVSGKRLPAWKPVCVRNSVVFYVLLKINLSGFYFHYLKNCCCGCVLCWSSWQCKEMGNWKSLGIQISAHSYAIFQGMYHDSVYLPVFL